MTEVKKTMTVANFDPNVSPTYKDARASENSTSRKLSNDVDAVDKIFIFSEMKAQVGLDREETIPQIAKTQLKPIDRTAGPPTGIASDYDVDDFIDNSKLSKSIVQEASAGKPFFLMRISAKTQDEEVIYIHTSAANFYNKNMEFDAAFEEQALTWMTCDVLMVTSPTEKPVRICDYAEIYFDEYDITHEQESIFLLNAKSVFQEQEIKKQAAAGYIAAMLEGGFLLPKDRHASKKIIDGIPHEERPLKLSFALEHLAERGSQKSFANWISMGASIQKAISHGFNPILHALMAKNWAVFDVILSADLSFLGKEKLIIYSDIAKEKGNLLVANQLYNKAQGALE